MSLRFIDLLPIDSEVQVQDNSRKNVFSMDEELMDLVMLANKCFAPTSGSNSLLKSTLLKEFGKTLRQEIC